MIKVWDYIDEYHAERKETLSAIEKVFESGRLILGDEVSGFETEFSKYCGTNYGIGVGNGTDALFLAMKAFDIGPGDEVITVPNTAVPTVSAIVATGAKPVFVDIDNATYLMDLDKINNAITKKTKAVIAVHLYGQCMDIFKLRQIVGDKIKIIEDCAQAHGARFKINMAGSMGDISAFSFYPTKILGTYGDGGMVLTSDQEIYARIKRLRFYGMESTYYSIENGYNSRLDEIHAAILRFKLKKLDAYLSRRKNIAAKYDAKLHTKLIKPQVSPGSNHAYYLYVVRHSKRDDIIQLLSKSGISVNVSYPWPVHVMPAFENLGYKVGDLPVAEAASKEILSLPMYASLRNDQVEFVIDIINAIMEDM